MSKICICFLGGSPLIGLSLWGSGPGFVAAAVLEFALFFGGIAIYLAWRRRSRAKVPVMPVSREPA